MQAQFPEIIARHGKWRAHQAAVIAEGGVLSWAEFDAATNKVANGLIDLGLMPGDTVGVLMSNSLDMTTILFGIAKAGCCSVPLNLSVTEQALGQMLVDAETNVLFVSDDQVSRLDAVADSEFKINDIPIIVAGTSSPRWRDFASWLKAQGGNSPGQLALPHLPMNIVYSSGTTGVPKGIIASFQGRMDWAYDLAIAFRFHSAAKTLIATGLYSNISWATMLSTMLAGGTIIVSSNKFDAGETLNSIVIHQITHTAMVPVQYQRLLETGSTEQFNLNSMECAITVGAPMHVDIKKKIHGWLSGALCELYGLTEGLITVMPGSEMPSRWESAGKPLQGADIQFWDEEGDILGEGQSGEIVGHARFIMPGYYNRPHDTALAIHKDAEGSKWLKTGDIGYQDHEGYIYVIDRKKDMILSGGQNIYPADIETALLGHACVSEVAVVGAKSSRWGETPVAFVVKKQGSKIEPQLLRVNVNKALGKQQRLAAIELVDILPRNPNGKILKRELRKRLDDRIYD